MYQIIYLRKNLWSVASTNKGRIFFLCLSLLLYVPANSQELPSAPNVDSVQVEEGDRFPKSRFTALLEMRAGYPLKKSGFQKLEIYGKPEWEIQLSNTLRFKAIGRIYIDPVDKLEPGKPHQMEVSRATRRGFIGDVLEVELRELYFDLTIKNHYLTVGKQQIVWGKADGLKILDVVNPTNFREFLLDDFDNSRIPLWSVKADIDLKKLKLQLVWIPDQTYHDLPDPGAAYYPSAFFPVPAPGVTIINNRADKPGRFFRDADAGARISAFIGGWDLTLNYLYMFDDFPVAKTSFSDNPGPTITMSPLYKRHHMAGGTFTNSFGKFSLRGELGFFIDKSFSTLDASKPGGIFKTTQFMGVAGLDYSGFSNSLVSVQVFEDYIFENMPVPARKRSATFLSLLLNRSFKNETFTAEIIGVQSISSGDGFARPSLKYQYKSNIILKAGADIFYGSTDTFLGQFNRGSRVTLGIQWGI
jgi:hypothetical protein